ncbi:RHS repeat-associated core domain-containing protein [Paenibacillus larvae]|uniref:RHS repeat-associated core domain-containing protein n=1 Tax=Paenibacillus larvae TaxID=1464 RepID=UPI00227F82BF|nr:RHS repeat-associated core domain-containing protein [Paenibacillus larvae]MCY9508783.1 RHS repeat-associated core domain-containing protein [Paenibacillus larvae]MCY9526824.1 RHS repeat-associated core domain-containing protein [Paenibacillus larvae]
MFFNHCCNLEQTIRPDGSKETRTYDAAGQLLTLSDRAADGSSISEYTFTYDANGNVSTEDNKVPDITVQGPEQEGAGLSPSTLLAGKAEMTYGKDNRLDTYNGMKVEYDADGNQITGPLGESRETFKYDARNRLIQAGQTAYAYNSENNRISVTKGNSVTKYVVNPHAMLSQILMETDGSGKGQAWYVNGLGLIGREDSQGTYQTYHYDRRGSTVALTASSGEVTDRYVYGPYGELLRKTGDTKQPFLYNGRDGVVTDDNGLYYMRARYYNPDIKRFINRDVLTGSISLGQSLNRYAYVNGNPVSYLDPFGLSRDSDTSPYAHAANFVLDFIPFVGSVKGAYEAFTA